MEGGKLKPVMILAPECVQQFQNVPTSKELGFEKIDQLTFWISLQAPKGTPKEIIQKMTAAIKEVLAQPDLGTGGGYLTFTCGQLMGAVLLVYTFFGQLPDLGALVGASIIVVSGICLLRLARR